jgi:hypothetical protein
VATYHPLPRYVSAEVPSPDPIERFLPEPAETQMLNPAWQRLAETIAVLDRGRGAVELAAQPVGRLSDVGAEHDRLAALLRELLDRDQAATGAWIAGGRLGADPRAEPPIPKR